MNEKEIYNAICKEVCKIEPNVILRTWENGNSYTLGEHMPVTVRAKERLAGWPRFYHTGKWQVNVDQANYTSKMFPPRKAGFDYAAIAECVISECKARVARKILVDDEKQRKIQFAASREAAIIRWLLNTDDDVAWQNRGIAERLRQLDIGTLENLHAAARKTEGQKK